MKRAQPTTGGIPRPLTGVAESIRVLQVATMRYRSVPLRIRAVSGQTKGRPSTVSMEAGVD